VTFAHPHDREIALSIDFVAAEFTRSSKDAGVSKSADSKDGVSSLTGQTKATTDSLCFLHNRLCITLRFFVDFHLAEAQHSAASPKSTFQKAVRVP